MPAFIDMTGLVCGGWTVIRRASLADGFHFEAKHVHWLCRCVCGEVGAIAGQNLRSGRSTSCGCLRKFATHRGFQAVTE